MRRVDYRLKEGEYVWVNFKEELDKYNKMDTANKLRYTVDYSKDSKDGKVRQIKTKYNVGDHIYTFGIREIYIWEIEKISVIFWVDSEGEEHHEVEYSCKRPFHAPGCACTCMRDLILEEDALDLEGINRVYSEFIGRTNSSVKKEEP